MNHNDRYKYLEEQHRILDSKISSLSQANPGDPKITEMKKQKLAMRDEMSRILKQQYQDREYVDMDDDR